MRIISKKIRYIVIFFSTLSIYFFSRLTVDDAFIGWRYGKNFVDHGIWNYNPTRFDLTEAYTNPLMVYLSIVPNILNFNIVLFYKLISLLVIFLFVYFISNKFKEKNLNILIFFAIPGVVFHIFGGLETVFFAIFVCLLFISLYEEKLLNSIIFTIILFFTRPESMTLLFLVPFYFLINIDNEKLYKLNNFNPLSFLSISKSNLKRFFLCFLVLAFILILNFYISYNYFGFLLPNPYYIKVTSFFKPSQLIFYSLFIIPSFYLIYIKRPKLFLLVILFFVPMAFVYSKSHLSMNYHGRFAFHIFGPVILFMIYLSHQAKDAVLIELERYNFKFKISEKSAVNVAILPFMLIFIYISSFEFRYTTTYYPRLLDAHGKLGTVISKVKNKYGIDSIAIGDAGLLPYNSNVKTLDLGRLGSSIATHRGLNEQLINEYDPKIIILRVNPENKKIYQDDIQRLVFKWLENRNYFKICDIIFHQQYAMRVYSHVKISEISNVCIESEVNNLTHHQYIIKNFYIPPWNFWK